MKTNFSLSEDTLLHGRFRIRHVIGSGGFGITYLGEDILLGSKVAIKEYMPEGFFRKELSAFEAEENEETQNRKSVFLSGLSDFLEEAKILSLLQELDGVVGIRDFFRENGTAYIVMDYLSGKSLKERVEQEGKIAPDEALRLLKPVIHALAVFHRTGYIHRDISSDNLLFTGQNQLKLIDFGAARRGSVTGKETHTVMFKRGYAAEEQYRERGKQGAWTDVYGICASFYFMLSGKAPAESIERVIRDEVLPLEKMDEIDLPAAKKKAIDKGMAVFKESRYASMEELYEVLYGEKPDFPELVLAEAKWKDFGVAEGEKTSRKEKIKKANFLASRTEFLEKRHETLESRRRERENRKKKRRWMVSFIAVAIAAGVMGLFLVRGGTDLFHPKKDTIGQKTETKITTTSPVPFESPVSTGFSVSVETPGKAQKVLVPALQGLSKKQAIEQIKEKGLICQLKRKYHDKVKKGYVISQSIRAGTRTELGKKIVLVLSRGKKKGETEVSKKEEKTATPSVKTNKKDRTSSSAKEKQKKASKKSSSSKSVDEILSDDKGDGDISGIFD